MATESERRSALGTGISIGMQLAGQRREAHHHRAQMEALERQQDALTRAWQRDTAERAEIAGAVAEQARAISYQTRLQGESARQAIAAQFALWRQTPDGQRFILWCDAKDNLLRYVHESEETYRWAIDCDIRRFLGPHEVDSVLLAGNVEIPQQPKVPDRIYIRKSHESAGKWILRTGKCITGIWSALLCVNAVSGIIGDSYLRGFWTLITPILAGLVMIVVGRKLTGAYFSFPERDQAIKDREQWNAQFGTDEAITQYRKSIQQRKIAELTKDLPIPVDFDFDQKCFFVAEYPQMWQEEVDIDLLNGFETWGKSNYPTADQFPHIEYPRFIGPLIGPRTIALFSESYDSKDVIAPDCDGHLIAPESNAISSNVKETHDYVSNLPQGYQTRIHDMNSILEEWDAAWDEAVTATEDQVGDENAIQNALIDAYSIDPYDTYPWTPTVGPDDLKKIALQSRGEAGSLPPLPVLAVRIPEPTWPSEVKNLLRRVARERTLE
jgi:hypothetical protein